MRVRKFNTYRKITWLSFACGWYGVVHDRCMPSKLVNVVNKLLSNCLPLSVMIFSGIPNLVTYPVMESLQANWYTYQYMLNNIYFLLLVVVIL